MIIEISNISGEPLQSQIIVQVKAQILRGLLPAGFALPSIRTLSRENHISVITVQRAYEALEREGLIISQPAKGFFVADIKKIDRFEMAKKSFKSKIHPIIISALNDGLSDRDIKDIVKKILKKKL